MELLKIQESFNISLSFSSGSHQKLSSFQARSRQDIFILPSISQNLYNRKMATPLSFGFRSLAGRWLGFDDTLGYFQ
jgi:hypothetical protein